MVLPDNRGNRARPSGGRELLADGGERSGESRASSDEQIETDGGESEAPDDEDSGSTADADEPENDGGTEAKETEQAEGGGAEVEDAPKETPEEAGETSVLYVTIPDGLFLDLLGLEIDLQKVDLQVSAVSGDGNLLGNLLDTVAGLLDAANLGRKLKSMLSFGEDGSAGERVRSWFSSLVEALPVEEFIGQLVTELVSELTETSEEGASSEEQASSEEAAG